MSVDMQGYAEVLSKFNEATASNQDSTSAERRIRVSLDATSNPEVALFFSSLRASSMLLPYITSSLQECSDSFAHSKRRHGQTAC